MGSDDGSTQASRLQFDVFPNRGKHVGNQPDSFGESRNCSHTGAV